MAKDKIFNIRVSEDDYAKLKQLGSIRAREILLDAVNDQLFEQVPKSEMERLIYKYDKLDTALANLEQKVHIIIYDQYSGHYRDKKLEETLTGRVASFRDRIKDSILQQ